MSKSTKTAAPAAKKGAKTAKTAKKFKVAIIGLDTSHSVALPKLMQDPATPAEQRISGLVATRALRFPSAFQSEEGQDKRQKTLESIGVKVTRDFDKAVADCDALMLEINDPALHLEFFEKCASLGKPIFLDKPFADDWTNTLKIVDIARKNNVRFFTSSSLRFDADFSAAVKEWGKANSATIWGPVGKAPAGSSVVWYGCHTVEMLETVMGRGAVAVTACNDRDGYVFHVIYGDGRRGVVDMSSTNWKYGACIRHAESGTLKFAECTCRIPFYCMLLKEIVKFLKGGQPVSLEDSLETMAVLDACDRAARSGKTEPVYHI